ncbi:hypothetical protein SAMN04488059_11879 [Devosia psychrophila]|uniref:Restriction endonuclease type I HsdR second RecA-like helicase domain-containing protein n=1 Tax=Devosia psychrophila TaxID=728005 RepID=A0A1I1P4D0_9HYPH|nr:hypothetical protein SAMN04488059_11879 [Devosia psychrophila]
MENRISFSQLINDQTRVLIRNKARREKLADRFRDASDPFKVVIVRDMWLTGFDAPSLHTMYLDKPTHIVTDLNGGISRNRKGERLRQFGHGSCEAALAILLRQYVFLRRRKQRKLLSSRPFCPVRPVEAVEQTEADLVFFAHQGDRVCLVDRSPASSTRIGVKRQRLP